MQLSVVYDRVGGFDEYVQVAVDAESDGFHGCWYVQVFGADVMTVIALAGQRTSRIQLGTSVAPTYPRHPVVMAQQALTTQAATNGRFHLGLGLSHAPVVEGMWGLSYDRPAVHMREYLTILNSLVKTGSAAFKGDFFRVAANVSVPVPQPPPVLIAALAPVMLRTAGEMTDGTITWMTGPHTLESHIVPRITRAAEAAGRPSPRVVVGLPVAVTDDEDAAREKAARNFAVYGSLPNYQRVLGIEGKGGSPASIAIVGNEAKVEAGIRAVASAGATEFAAAPFPVGDDARASLERTRALLKGLIGKV